MPTGHRRRHRAIPARRRWPAVLVGAALVTSCSTVTEPAPPAVAERVAVEQGELLGVADAGVLRYRGVPYAAPPVGELRWQPPQPPAGWTGIRSATGPGPHCPQPGGSVPPRTPAAGDSEDCLTLDVTIPAGTAAGSRLPVLVWVHGDGLGLGVDPDLDPRRLVEAGPLAVVTVRHRLGILGYLGLGGLAGSGSFGLLDQQAALAWVQRNITSFGGDPDAVTLGGHSTGADAVCSQIASPGGLGLFRQAILQSGGCGTANIVDVVRPGTGPAGDTWKPLPLVEAAGVAAAGALGCGDPASALACLRALPVSRLAGAGGGYWSPATGTPTLPRRPSDLLAARDLRPLPLLAGTTRDEGTAFTAAYVDRLGTPLTDEAFLSRLAVAAGSQAVAAARAYPRGDRSPGRAWSEVVTDRAFACPALASYQVLGSRAPLHAYEFADPTAPPITALPSDLAGGATHGAELAYLFDLPGQPARTGAQQVTAAEMVGAWARFVTTGDPGTAGTPWPRWVGDGTILTITGTGSVARPGADFAIAHRCALWGT